MLSFSCSTQNPSKTKTSGYYFLANSSYQREHALCGWLWWSTAFLQVHPTLSSKGHHNHFHVDNGKMLINRQDLQTNSSARWMYSSLRVKKKLSMFSLGIKHSIFPLIYSWKKIILSFKKFLNRINAKVDPWHEIFQCTQFTFVKGMSVWTQVLVMGSVRQP